MSRLHTVGGLISCLLDCCQVTMGVSPCGTADIGVVTIQTRIYTIEERFRMNRRIAGNSRFQNGQYNKKIQKKCATIYPEVLLFPRLFSAYGCPDWARFLAEPSCKAGAGEAVGEALTWIFTRSVDDTTQLLHMT